MPTAARLVGALFFAGLAFLVSGLIIPYLPDGTKTHTLGPINSAVGLLCGWTVMGPRAIHGAREAFAGGLTTMIAMIVGALLIFSGIEMVNLSMRRRYDGAMEAVVGVFEIARDYALMIAQPDVIGMLVVGAILGGIVSHIAARNWS